MNQPERLKMWFDGLTECLSYNVTLTSVVSTTCRNSLDIDIIKQCGISELEQHGRKLRTGISISPEGNRYLFSIGFSKMCLDELRDVWKIDSYERQWIQHGQNPS